VVAVLPSRNGNRGRVVPKRRLPFEILKLRTMRKGRVTRLGSFLRPAGIDELTQFYNVLCGEMRLIGPRPVTEEDAIRWNWTETDPPVERQPRNERPARSSRDANGGGMPCGSSASMRPTNRPGWISRCLE
jgi:hypothetical protein